MVKDKVYVIVSGEYSDTHYHGFFEDREKAEIYCALKNNRNNPYSDAYFIDELSKINADLPSAEDICLQYRYHIQFNFDKKEHRMLINSIDYDCYIGEYKKVEAVWSGRPDVIGSMWIKFSINAKSEEQAKKIAQDKMAEFLHYYSEKQSYQKAIESINKG